MNRRQTRSNSSSLACVSRREPVYSSCGDVARCRTATPALLLDGMTVRMHVNDNRNDTDVRCQYRQLVSAVFSAVSWQRRHGRSFS